jgi:hypothetical protein
MEKSNLGLTVFVDDPYWEVLQGVLQFSKHYHHTKFEVIISNGYRVLEAIPSETIELD